MKHFITFSLTFLLILTIIFGSLLTVFAQQPPASQTPSATVSGTPAPSGYQLLAPLTDNIGKTVDTKNITRYIIGLYYVIIGLSGVLAVLFIVIGGFIYISSDSFKDKGKGKAWIQNALWGLLLVLGSALILQTINPNLLRLSNLGLNVPGASGINNSNNGPLGEPTPTEQGWWIRKVISSSEGNTHEFIKVGGAESDSAQCNTKLQEVLNGGFRSSYCFYVPSASEAQYICLRVYKYQGYQERDRVSGEATGPIKKYPSPNTSRTFVQNDGPYVSTECSAKQSYWNNHIESAGFVDRIGNTNYYFESDCVDVKNKSTGGVCQF
jgi:hypothetical protein